MSTILPPNDLAFFRSIAKTAAVLLVCLRIDEIYPGRAIADYEIADILEQDPRTTVKQLRSLSASGLMLEQRENKYVVTVLGRNTLMAYRQQTLLSIEETENYSETPILCAQNVLHEAHFVPHDMNDDAKFVELTDSSSSINESAQFVQILQATHLLFGSSVSDSGITEKNPIHALCWISKAYADKGKLTNPAGLVYKRLKENQRPPVYLIKEPTRGLPQEYLSAIGIQKINEPEVISDLDEAESESVDDEQCLQADETVTQRLNDGKSMSAEQAWQSVLGQLQMEMQRASFDTWLRDTKAVHFEDGTLQVGVVNNNSRDWLENRMQRTVERLLVGILNAEINVEFVVRENE